MAVHLQRLLPYLDRAGISVQMYSIGRRTPRHPLVRQVSDHKLIWFLKLLFGPCEPVHYVFSDNTWSRFAAALLAKIRQVNVVLRIGGESLANALRSHRVIDRYLTRLAIRSVTVVIGVNEAICELALLNGARRVLHIPGFIAPSSTSEVLPPEVATFLHADDGPVLLASGEIQGSGNSDLYGAYALIDLLECLPQVRLIYFAYRITLGEDRQQQLATELRRRSLERRYLLFRSDAELFPVMRYCDLLIRPTLSDGDANSVREALHVGLPVVASDCVKRPEGVVTFHTGNLAELKNAVTEVLNNQEKFRTRVRALKGPNNAKPVVALFKELLNRTDAAAGN